jgi:hypothetical protein
MLDVVCCQPVEICALTTRVGRLDRRLLPGGPREGGPTPVDVHVRSYEEALPPAPRLAGPESGYVRLPVGSILDCYV